VRADQYAINVHIAADEPLFVCIAEAHSATAERDARSHFVVARQVGS
jgi:hypothetical protein